jgi:sulfotransferase
MENMSGGSEFAPFFTDARRRSMLLGLFQSYYAEEPADRVVFDTNRRWTGKLAVIGELFPDARVICCVREVSWIIDSIELMLDVNPLQTSRLFNFKAGGSVYARVETLMNPGNGLIGDAWSLLREAWFGIHAKRRVVVRYGRLAREPHETMRRLYRELGEQPFEHDFDNLSYDEDAYDALLGMPGMHRVRRKVNYEERESCLPPDLRAKYADVNFWENPKLNQHSVTVL